MLWVQSLHDYWAQTGDSELLAQLYPTLQLFLTYLQTYEDVTKGLLDVPEGEWYETALIDWRGRHSRFGLSTALNAMYYGTLRDAAIVADVVGKPGDARRWSDMAHDVRRATNRYLFRAGDQRYYTAIHDGQSYPPTPHAQAWALAYGLVPARRVDRVADALIELVSDDPQERNVELYGLFWVLEALGKSRRIDEALHLIERYYGYMLDAGATTWWENLRSGERYRESLSHAWGGSPTWFLTSYVLGARRTGPNTWLVQPAFSGVDYVSGSLPLAEGELKASWLRQDPGVLTLSIVSPHGTTGEAVVPLFCDEMVLDGTAEWFGEMAGQRTRQS
jgi:alpha-L-rhamnosidase